MFCYFFIYAPLGSNSYWGRSKIVCNNSYAKVLYSRIRACEICIEDLDIYKDIGDNAYMDFFSLPDCLIVNTKT